MSPSVHLVLSCTNRKHAPSGAYPRLRDIRGQNVDARATAWIDAVADAEPRVPVSELYAGEYWTTALALAQESSRHRSTQVWVISAGLGLVRLDDLVPAYAATLAPGHPDSVTRGTEGREARGTWWHRLAEWDGPSGVSRPRCLADLDVPEGATVVVCAGRAYVDAVAADLVALQGQTSDDCLLLVSSGVAPPGLEQSWLSVPGQLRMRFGGSMSSTGARTCTALVEHLAPAGELSASGARKLVSGWAQESAPLPVFDRKRLSDTDVSRWIERDIAKVGATNRTASLRRLRESGVACEQGRFGRLFDLAVEVAR